MFYYEYKVKKQQGKYYGSSYKTGVHLEYWSNGNKKSSITYNKNEADGPRTYWYENGNKKSENTNYDQYYSSHYKAGKDITYYEDGTRESEGEYFSSDF